jgi:restriction endonuclease S subunit
MLFLMSNYEQLPAKIRVKIIAGDDVTMPYQIGTNVVSNGTTTFVPTNITGYTFESVIQNMASNETAAIQILNASNGSIAVKWTDTQTSNLTTGCGSNWYLVMIDKDQYERTIVAGDVEVYSRV